MTEAAPDGADSGESGREIQLGPVCMLGVWYSFPAGPRGQPGALIHGSRQEPKLLAISFLILSLSLLPWDWELGYASCQGHSFLVN